MPTYFYKCTKEDCGHVREDDARMSTYEDHHPPCTECGSVCNYTFIPTVPQIAFKDGPTGSWPSKGNHFKEYRRKQSEAAEKRQRDRYGDPQKGAVPNFEGKEARSWVEAQAEALVKRGPESAATYNSKVAEEKSKKIET